MKKYILVTVSAVVIIGAILMLLLNRDREEKTVSSTGDQKTSESTKSTPQPTSENNNPKDKVSTPQNPKPGDNVLPTDKKEEEVNLEEKQEETIREIKSMYQPRWDEINQLADKRLAELLVQAGKEYKVNKERKQDVARLEMKYLDIYNGYEQSTKAQVDDMVASIQKEVIKRDIHDNIGEEYLQMYQIQKEKRVEKLREELKKL
ncbi:hypothetical protein [Neobacillus sp. CF12]|uniref:hypothetical protein n=1 Tax=Neobacillus sp. CF12 TaxID=3055864 RepID=UPI0025A146C7|nr:hypothetical protein [Neobacillus sp. CF12]MDM5329802.1 hypothetical protein [Neobacillus sp. CF12]